MNVLITGCAGFIGSHLLERLLKMEFIDNILGIDDFSTGKVDNLREVKNECPHLWNKFRLINHTLGSYEKICLPFKIDLCFHLAALGSVPRSMICPDKTYRSNVNGTIQILELCRTERIKRIVFASSSSVYGSDTSEIKKEDIVGQCFSPYALSKKIGELLLSNYNLVYGLETVSLRFFNVFGPRQNPSGDYAAVIPKFITSIFKEKKIFIYGDGNQKRDFTYIDNILNALILSGFKENKEICGQVFNIGRGDSKSVNDLVYLLRKLINKNVDIHYSERRNGDVLNSQADVTKANKLLDFYPYIDFIEGIKKTISYYERFK